MTKSLIPVVTKNAEILVDSRIIAAEMEVDHGNWFRNIVQKYQREIEENFGVFRFKNGKLNGRGRPEKYCMLTEDQAYYVLTLSRNSKKVVELKAKLVKSFSQCRKQIQLMQIEIAKNQSLPSWQEERKKTKLVNKRLNDAVANYNDRHQEMSDRRISKMFTVVATASSIAVVGCAPWVYKRKKLVSSFRDALNEEQLRVLELIENLAAYLIENQDIYPKEAIEQAAEVIKPKNGIN